jgi:hypothetical protein
LFSGIKPVCGFAFGTAAGKEGKSSTLKLRT